VLDAAVGLHELFMLGDEDALRALETLSRKVRKAVEQGRKRRRRSPKADEGARMLALLRGCLGRKERSRDIAEQLGVWASYGPSLGLRVDGGRRYGLWIGEAELAKAARAIQKHRELHEYSGEDRQARAVLLHALEAFGVKSDAAKAYAGLRQKR
jgi:hypothetical protein